MSNDGTENAASDNSQPTPAFMGNKTLFVDTAATQKAAYSLSLPPLAPGFKQLSYETVAAQMGATATNDTIEATDWLRYNLGKFFYRGTAPQNNPDSGNYDADAPDTSTHEFINPATTGDVDSSFSSLSLEPYKYSNCVKYTCVPSSISLYKDLYKDLIFRDVAAINVRFWSEEHQDSELKDQKAYLLGGPQDNWPIEKQITTLQDWAGFVFSQQGDNWQSLYNKFDVAADDKQFGSQQELWKTKYMAGIQGLGVPFYDIIKEEPNIKATIPAPGFVDHAFIFDSPADSSIRDTAANVRILFGNVEAKYNFYQEEYETATQAIAELFSSVGFIAGQDVAESKYETHGQAELYLPNFNVILAERQNEINGVGAIEIVQSLQTDSNYFNHSTLGGRLPINILRPVALVEGDMPEISGPRGTSGNEYLRQWGHVFKTETAGTALFDDTSLRNTAKKFKNIIFPLSAVKNENITTYKSSFPFYNEINFNTDINTKMADILHDSNLFLPLVSDYIAFVDPDTSYAFESVTFASAAAAKKRTTTLTAYAQEITAPGLQSTNYGAMESYDFPLNAAGSSRKQYFFDNFAEGIQNLNPSSNLVGHITSIQNKTISVGSEEFSDQEIEFFAENPLIQLIYKSMFKAMFIEFVKKHRRLYSDIVAGKTCYNETLFYRIEKRDGAGQLIQSFYVLNDSQLDEATLIDTQIVYSKKYSYQIFAVQMVVGNRYRYGANTEQAFETGDPHWAWQAHINVVDDVSIMLFEIPYTSTKTVYAQELPPTPPDVNFIPYRNKDSQVMISLNASMDDYYDDYIPILPDDVDKIQNAQIGTSGKVHFRSEGDITGFDMFRISQFDFPNGPTSYSDFGIENVGKKVTLSAVKGAPSLIDAIIPNTKYWYTFRTNDAKHEGSEWGVNFQSQLSDSYNYSNAPDFSNPTDVYEIQAVNNNGAIYFIMKTYDIGYFDAQKQIAARIPTRPFRKYLLIKPNIEQSLINQDPENSGMDFDDPEIKASIKDYLENFNDNAEFVPLGIKEQSIFGFEPNSVNEYNQFKVRLISSKTGRKVDVHLRFKKPVLEK